MPLELPSRLNAAEHFIFRPAREHPNRVAILGEPRPVSYGELAELTSRVAGALAGLGCTRGARVLLVLPDSAEFVSSFFGTVAIGAVAVPVNASARPADYAYYLADSGARIAIVHSNHLESVLPALEAGGVDHVVVVEGHPAGSARFIACGWDDWLAGAVPVSSPSPAAASDVAFFLYTSGSGGTPKAAVHRQMDMLATSRCYAAGVLGLRPDDRTFSVSKLFFAYGLGNAMYFPLDAGAATILFPGRPRPEAVAEIVARHRPTIFYAVPTFYAALLRQMGEGLRLDFSSVRLAVSAGEPLPAEIFERFRERFGLEILDGIGSTEMLHMFLSPMPGRCRAGSCGFEVPGYSAQVVDDDGRPAPDGTIGNLWVRGPSAFDCYWNKPELTARAKPGEWVVTGDKFFRDADGFYHYCGRGDDMLKVAGMWVAPAEVENALLAHPAVAEVAVVGGLFDGLTRPVAYVVPRNDQAGDSDLAQSLRQFVRERLPSYKAPTEVHFLTELPKTATGKIQRFKLRQR